MKTPPPTRDRIGKRPLTTATGIPAQKLDFVYDSQGRRISKTVSASNNGITWTFLSNQRFLYDGWNLIAEYSAPTATSTSLTLQATHTWGIDLSGSPQGAGGVGGLLATHLVAAPAAAYFPAYDGNGNISAWIDGTGTLLARMDYSPFGQLIAQYKFTPAGSTTLSRLSFGFSTKYTDAESGLIYYGYRYYESVSGRWISKDPIEERGGRNLYAMVENCGVFKFDRLGLEATHSFGPRHPFDHLSEALNDVKKYLREKVNKSMKNGWEQFNKIYGLINREDLRNLSRKKLEEKSGDDFTLFIHSPKGGEANWILIFGREVASSVYCYQSKEGNHPVRYSYNYYEGSMNTKAEYMKGQNLGRVTLIEANKLLTEKKHSDGSQILGKHKYFVHTHLMEGWKMSTAMGSSVSKMLPKIGLSSNDKFLAKDKLIETIAIESDGRDYFNDGQLRDGSVISPD